MSAPPLVLSHAPTRLDIEDSHRDVLGDVLSLGLLRQILYKRVEAHAPWGMNVGARNRAILYLFARGHARLELDGHAPLALKAGHVAFLPRGAAHVLRDSRLSPALAVCDGAGPRLTTGARRIGGRGAVTDIVAAFFERDLIPPMPLTLLPEVLLLSRHGNDDGVAATISLVLGELESPGPASVLLLQRLVDVLVVQAVRALAKEERGAASSPRREHVALFDPPIYRALALMHAQLAHAWSVSDLASRVGLSRSGFAARFAQRVGEPPLQYLARWRIARAAELLRETEEAISVIAARVGYDSTPSFNKAFRRWQGTNPRAYRRAAWASR